MNQRVRFRDVAATLAVGIALVIAFWFGTTAADAAEFDRGFKAGVDHEAWFCANSTTT